MMICLRENIYNYSSCYSLSLSRIVSMNSQLSEESFYCKSIGNTRG